MNGRLLVIYFRSTENQGGMLIHLSSRDVDSLVLKLLNH